VLNPAGGHQIAQVTDMRPEDADKAIEAAANAFPAWSALTAKERGVILRKWFDLIVANADDLAAILTAEQGKPLAEAKGEVLYGAAFIDWFAEEAKRAYGETIPSPIKGARIMTIKQPIGVCAMITPWNFPSAMITRKVGPALAAGCTVVLKPAEDTPLSALALAVLGEEAGIPAGVLNIVTTSDSVHVGQALCANPLVRKLVLHGFDGSWAYFDEAMFRYDEEGFRSSSEVMRRSSFLMMRIWMPQWMEQLLLQVPECRSDLCLCQPHLRAR
jgi:succinate-semialdehyde dehydrogenase/glutarate-semialdehyde dehydrogenase